MLITSTLPSTNTTTKVLCTQATCPNWSQQRKQNVKKSTINEINNKYTRRISYAPLVSSVQIPWWWASYKYFHSSKTALKEPHSSWCAPKQSTARKRFSPCPGPLADTWASMAGRKPAPCFSFPYHKQREQCCPGVIPIILQFDPNTLLGTTVAWTWLFRGLWKPWSQENVVSFGGTLWAPRTFAHYSHCRAAWRHGSWEAQRMLVYPPRGECLWSKTAPDLVVMYLGAHRSCGAQASQAREREEGGKKQQHIQMFRLWQPTSAHTGEFCVSCPWCNHRQKFAFTNPSCLESYNSHIRNSSEKKCLTLLLTCGQHHLEGDSSHTCCYSEIDGKLHTAK